MSAILGFFHPNRPIWDPKSVPKMDVFHFISAEKKLRAFWWLLIMVPSFEVLLKPR